MVQKATLVVLSLHLFSFLKSGIRVSATSSSGCGRVLKFVRISSIGCDRVIKKEKLFLYFKSFIFSILFNSRIMSNYYCMVPYRLLFVFLFFCITPANFISLIVPCVCMGVVLFDLGPIISRD